MTALRLAALALLLALSAPAAAQTRPRTARIREYVDTFTTYPFSDPDPIPAVGRIYPYFRFDGFTETGRRQGWKVVELENDYIRLIILPEIGGKIWGAIEKKTGRPFIYFNHVVKFRDIAMRGPWTSGGIEANYGILGHTPNVSTPVDYAIRRNADGSISCITGALDLLTMTSWRLETRLAPDQAYFTTRSTWHNGSALEQPYYTWMTAGIPTRGNLEYVFPGSAWIGHDGEPGTWPLNQARGRDIRWYERNDFGPYKSYHVLNGAGDFFGGYWHDFDLGMARVAPRDEKPGQKIWIWGLSRQGMIWENLLTDSDGQYSELQSGRLFNQSAEGSTFTPFKHRGFTPHRTDRWTERWMPVVGTKGFVVASAAGALNVTVVGDRLALALSPAEPIADSLVVSGRGRILAARRIVRAPLAPWSDTIALAGIDPRELRITLGRDRLVWEIDSAQRTLDRPLALPKEFDWSSAYGLWTRGKELIREREYLRAVPVLDSALAKDPFFAPALTDRAALAYRAMQYPEARAFARRALAIDTYDGAANYYYGLASRRLDRPTDARDGFEIASQSYEWRAAAYAELAKLALVIGEERRAADYAAKLLAEQPGDLDALGVRLVIARRRGDAALRAAALRAIDEVDPLSPLARFERLLAGGARDPGATLLHALKGEMPEQQLFELASWYLGCGERDAALRLLVGVGEHPEALYWRALLEPEQAAGLRARADALSPVRVLPFRPEILDAIAAAQAGAPTIWQRSWYLALGQWHAGNLEVAGRLLAGVGDRPEYAPLYAARAAFPGRTAPERRADLERAAQLDPGQWRYGRLLVEELLRAKDPAGAVAVAARYRTAFPENYILGLGLARAFLAAGRYRDADATLATLHIIPFEGSAEGHVAYREAKLMLAVDAMRGSRWDEAAELIAAAREWPERLGAGAPYPADVDTRCEELLEADLARRRGSDSETARAARERLGAWALQAGGVDGRVLAAWRALP